MKTAAFVTAFTIALGWCIATPTVAHAGRAYAIGCDPASIHNGRMRDPKYRHHFERFQRSHGFSGSQGHEQFDALHPFIKANYGDQVIMVGASANSGTGKVVTGSKGVVANESLDASLRGKQPLPDVTGVHTSLPRTPKASALKSLCAGAAACELLGVLKATMPRGSVHARRLAAVQHDVQHKLGDAWKFTVREDNQIALVGQNGTCHVQLSYRPGDGVFVRSTEQTRDGKGTHVFLKSEGGQLNVGSADLAVEKGSPTLRHIPVSSATSSIERPAALDLSQWGL